MDVSTASPPALLRPKINPENNSRSLYTTIYYKIYKKYIIYRYLRIAIVCTASQQDNFMPVFVLLHKSDR